MVVVCENRACNFQHNGFCGKETVVIQFNGGCSEFFNKHGQVLGYGSQSIENYTIQGARDRVKIVDAEESDLRVIDQDCPHDLKESLEEKENKDALSGDEAIEVKVYDVNKVDKC